MLDVVLPDGESSEIPDMDAPESIKEVDTAQEAVKTFEDLWLNLRYQHRASYQGYFSGAPNIKTDRTI